MIQRKQTIWLLLSILIIVLSAFLPFAHKSIIDVLGVAQLQKLTTKDFPFLAVCSAASIVMALIAIFLFKNRKIQKLLCLFGILASIGIIILEVMYGNKATENTAITFGIGLPIISVLLLIKAYADINADDKLVKSIDRLRD